MPSRRTRKILATSLLAAGLLALVFALWDRSGATPEDKSLPENPSSTQGEASPLSGLDRAQVVATEDPAPPPPTSPTAVAGPRKRRIHVAGRIDGGTLPMPDAFVYVRDLRGGKIVGRVKPSDDATFSLDVDVLVISDPWECGVGLWMSGRTRHQVSATSIAGAAVDVVLRLSDNVLASGRVIDERDRPLPGFRFLLCAYGPAPDVADSDPWVRAPGDSGTLAVAETDTRGEFEIRGDVGNDVGKNSQLHVVAADPDIWMSLVSPRRFLAGTTDVVLRAEPAYTVTIRYEMDSTVNSWTGTAEAISKEDPRRTQITSNYSPRWPLILRGRRGDIGSGLAWDLKIYAEGHRPFRTTIEVPTGQQRANYSFRLEALSALERGTVRITSSFLDVEGKTVRPFVRIIRKLELAVTSEFPFLRPASPTAWELDLPIGSQTLQVSPESFLGDGVVATVKVSVQSAVLAEPDLQFPPFGSIRLRLPPNRTSSAEILVSASKNGSERSQGVPFVQGEALLPAVPEGTWILRCTVDGVALSSTVEVQAKRESVARLEPVR